MSPGRVTVFGGSGFIGRSIVERLVAEGASVRVGVRHPEKAVFEPPAGAQGSVELVYGNVQDEAAISAAVDAADHVINLVGILHETRRQKFAPIHEEGARRVAAAAKKAGVHRLVHMSALGASETSPSEYARSKAAGERAVRRVFPEATIVRPSVVFGPRDDFFNRFARMALLSPALPLIGGGKTRFQPVYVGDVARAYSAILADPGTQGRTYELGGPDIHTFRRLMEILLAEIDRKRLLLPLPFFVAEILGTVLQALPRPPITRDQVELLRADNVVSGTAPGLADLGIDPTPLRAILPTYLEKYRRG
ncbi:complex I NDUFA9 subunit family protein [Actibacterium sp. MT2.3-13A]|uniref:complex I NDUFA9 subunit family protein n=1 Tax=Actibacterium sp. MT2.3-13A TaxID=2828332 RepID=UPI001BA8F8C9|nr:complex I NDUFA9 subunit family protein [Actibacterium sp. MT2.3-13A]